MIYIYVYIYIHTYIYIYICIYVYICIYICIGINGKVIDVSYGGKEMYGKGGPYFLFAGDIYRCIYM
jgi:hypothetical protein